MDAQATFSYSFDAIRCRAGRTTAQHSSVGGPQAASPGTAKSGHPSARWCSTDL